MLFDQVFDFSMMLYFLFYFGQMLKLKLMFQDSDFWLCNPQNDISSFLNHLLLQSDNAAQEASDSHFMRLVQNLLRDPEERKNFFQVSFGCILPYKDV